MKIRDPLTGLYEELHAIHPSSNETWSNAHLEAMAEVEGEHAVIAGSGNAPNILPLIKGLGSVTFADIEPIHGHVFNLKLKAAATDGPYSNEQHLNSVLGEGFGYDLRDERWEFDMERVPLYTGISDAWVHWTMNRQARERFLAAGKELVVMDRKADFFNPEDVSNIGNRGMVGWVHISNIPTYHRAGRIIDGDTKLMDFLGAIGGVNGETMVSWSRIGNVKCEGNIIHTGTLCIELCRFSEIVSGDIFGPFDVSSNGADSCSFDLLRP